MKNSTKKNKLFIVKTTCPMLLTEQIFLTKKDAFAAVADYVFNKVEQSQNYRPTEDMEDFKKKSKQFWSVGKVNDLISLWNKFNYSKISLIEKEIETSRKLADYPKSW